MKQGDMTPGGAILTQPSGGGHKIEPRRFYERWQEAGCQLEKTSELCTFLSRLAAGGGCWGRSGDLGAISS